MKTTAKLRQLLKSESLIVAPFVLNAFHAKIAESVGLPAVYMTGAGTSAERGFPDVGLLTMTEMVANAKYIAGAVDIPVICDADTGYGNPLNVQRTIREYESAGVAGVHIEDQLFPKKCGFFAGKQVITKEEEVQKITRTVQSILLSKGLQCHALGLQGQLAILNESFGMGSLAKRVGGEPAVEVLWKMALDPGQDRYRLLEGGSGRKWRRTGRSLPRRAPRPAP